MSHDDCLYADPSENYPIGQPRLRIRLRFRVRCLRAIHDINLPTYLILLPIPNSNLFKTHTNMSLPQTQTALALAGKRQPLTTVEVPVYAPSSGEVAIHVHWTASTPLDLHRADGGLLVDTYPVQSSGGGISGTIAAIGSGDVKGLSVGDRVTSYAWHGGKQSGHQPYATVPANFVSKIADSMPLKEAVTVPTNLVTAVHTITADLKLDLPWPKPEHHAPAHADDAVLVWGASSSVGMYVIQVLRYWGYTNILAVASGRHAQSLKQLGASKVFDYTKDGVVEEIKKEGDIPRIVDCIGSVEGTMAPLTKIATSGSIVAVMLPVIVSHASDADEPEYEMDASKVLVGKWAQDVDVRGVRTHFYTDVSCFGWSG